MNKRKTGQEQEAKAACFLKTQGYQILERNYRCKKGEIDLIAREGQYLVFVEVKYRSTNESGLPEEAVDLHSETDLGGSLVSDRERSGYLYTVQIRCGGD